MGCSSSQLNNFTLAPIAQAQVSEAAGVNSAAGSFGLSFGLAVAGGAMLAVLSFTFTNMTQASVVIPESQQSQISHTLEHSAEVMSNTQLEQLVIAEPPAVKTEILHINTVSRNRSLQVALLVPVLAGLFGIFFALRMRRLPDVAPQADIEGASLA